MAWSYSEENLTIPWYKYYVLVHWLHHSERCLHCANVDYAQSTALWSLAPSSSREHPQTIRLKFIADSTPDLLAQLPTKSWLLQQLFPATKLCPELPREAILVGSLLMQQHPPAVPRERKKKHARLCKNAAAALQELCYRKFNLKNKFLPGVPPPVQE